MSSGRDLGLRVTTPTAAGRTVSRALDAARYMTLLASHRAGQGEPLLLLHGIGSTRDDFSALLHRLAENFDVLSLDLPGHGGSPAPGWPPTVAALTDAVEADLDARGLARVHILGNSLGARIGIELAARHRTLSVVAISPSGLRLPAEPPPGLGPSGRAAPPGDAHVHRAHPAAHLPVHDRAARDLAGRSHRPAGG